MNEFTGLDEKKHTSAILKNSELIVDRYFTKEDGIYKLYENIFEKLVNENVDNEFSELDDINNTMDIDMLFAPTLKESVSDRPTNICTNKKKIVVKNDKSNHHGFKLTNNFSRKKLTSPVTLKLKKTTNRN